jgi:ATP phosphoribosyltransferase regulatory subunit
VNWGAAVGIAIDHGDGQEEPAIGFSLYPDPLIDAGLRCRENSRRIFLPLGHDAEQAKALRGEGWRTVAALSDADEGRALGCTHRLEGADPVSY